MAKSHAERATGEAQDTEPFAIERRQDLTPEEQVELRKFFQSSAWKKAIFNTRLQRPQPGLSARDFPDPKFFPPTAELRAQLVHEKSGMLAGWKAFELALAKECIPPPAPRQAPQDSFPDSGRIVAPQPAKP